MTDTVEIRSAVKAVVAANNGAFIRSTTTWTESMYEAGKALAQACGVPAATAATLRQHELRALFSVAARNGADGAAMAAKQGWTKPVAGSVPTAFEGASQATTTATVIAYDDSALQAQIAALLQLSTDQAKRINELEARTPRAVEITIADAPKVTFTHAHHMLPRVLRYAANGENIWLCGPRGSGKSTAAEQVAKALGVACYVMTGADAKTDLEGWIQLHDGSLKRTPFRDAWELGGVICLDEMDSYDPAALIVINDALANGTCTFPDGRIPRHANCVVIAGTNTDGTGQTSEYSARSVIDGSTRDRFAFIPWQYDLALETSLGAANPQWTKYVQAVRQAMADLSMDDAPSPRATIKGAKAIAFGETWEEAAEALIFRGMKPDQVRRINAAVSMDDYSAANKAA